MRTRSRTREHAQTGRGRAQRPPDAPAATGPVAQHAPLAPHRAWRTPAAAGAARLVQHARGRAQRDRLLHAAAGARALASHARAHCSLARSLAGMRTDVHAHKRTHAFTQTQHPHAHTLHACAQLRTHAHAQEVDFASNLLLTLPSELAECTALRIIKASNNRCCARARPRACEHAFSCHELAACVRVCVRAPHCTAID